MTPLQFAHAECSNWNQGACSGARIADDLSPLPGCPLEKCLLADEKRCKYFEESVLPMAAMMSDPTKSKSYMDAVAGLQVQAPHSWSIPAMPRMRRSTSDTQTILCWLHVEAPPKIYP